MLLAIDIGNTHTVIGVYDGKTLKADWRITSGVSRTEDEVGIEVKAFCLDAGIPVDAIDKAGISSVVPNLTPIYEKMVSKYFDVIPMIISSELPLGLAIRYDDPSSVGADRLCNAVAGFAQFGGPLIIIDFGTATTYDVISSTGEYLGGVIAPGIETSSAELHRRAAKLPKIDLFFPKTVVGTSTVSSMQSGILYGAVDSVEGMIRRIAAELHAKPTVLATGGFSAVIGKQSPMITHTIPSLVLDGIRLIVERLNNRP